MLSTYEKEKNKMLTSALDDGCQRFFEKNNFLLELGYAKILTEQLDEAKSIFQSICEKDIRAKWALMLVNILLSKPALYPSYFEIRNFLEIDLNLLILYQKGDYTQEIINYAEIFSSINLETYKYLGRVFWNNGLDSIGKFFLLKAKDTLYADPELHFLLANVYLKENNIEKTISALDTCISILPQYFPAIDMKRKLTQN